MAPVRLRAFLLFLVVFSITSTLLAVLWSGGWPISALFGENRFCPWPAVGEHHKSGIDWTQWESDATGHYATAPVSYRVHAFYYAWYNAPVSGQLPNPLRHWKHWNHRRLPYWIQHAEGQYVSGIHRPPKDIGANFYPKLDPYSSVDREIWKAHFRMARFAGIGVLVVSWYPAGMADDNGEPMDSLVMPLLDMALIYGIKLCLHIEPYRGRTSDSIVSDLKYALNRGYTTHAAYYRLPSIRSDPLRPIELPVFFVYDSYTVNPKDWARILTTSGSQSIRGQLHDAYIIGLLISRTDCVQFGESGFDGGYTYFIGQLTTDASFPLTWSDLGRACRTAHVGFFPSIGPGYDDLAIRPHNKFTTISRSLGNHYRSMFEAAVDSKLDGLGITSFNEWGEGTQIEPAKPFRRCLAVLLSRPYMDYRPYSPEFYLRLTRVFVNKFNRSSSLPTDFYLTDSEELSRLTHLTPK